MKRVFWEFLGQCEFFQERGAFGKAAFFSQRAIHGLDER